LVSPSVAYFDVERGAIVAVLARKSNHQMKVGIRILHARFTPWCFLRKNRSFGCIVKIGAERKTVWKTCRR